MSVPFRPYTDFLSIVGMKAAGKTTVTKHFCSELDKLIFIDPTWQLGEIGYVVHFAHRIRVNFKKFGKVIYQPKHMDEATYTEVFSECLELSNYTLGVDEIDKFARKNWFMCPEVNEIINRGRAQGIGLICNTRRPAMLHRDIRSNTDHIVCFTLIEEDDRKYMSTWLQVPADAIRDLPFYESYYRDIKAKKTVKLKALQL